MKKISACTLQFQIKVNSIGIAYLTILNIQGVKDPVEVKLVCDFPVSMDRSYRGFLSYVFQKQDMIQNDPLEQPTWEGIKLMISFIIHFPSIWKGYRRFPDLDASIQRETDRGNKVLLSEEGDKLVLKLRTTS